MESMRDSVETALNLKLVSSLENSSYYHIFQSELVQYPLSKCKELNNFDEERLSSEPYPENNRPRGKLDLESVLYHRQ